MIYKGKKYGPTQVKVLSMLVKYRVVGPTVQEIAVRTSLSYDAVQKAVRRLVKAKVVKRSKYGFHLIKDNGIVQKLMDMPISDGTASTQPTPASASSEPPLPVPCSPSVQSAESQISMENKVPNISVSGEQNGQG